MSRRVKESREVRNKRIAIEAIDLIGAIIAGHADPKADLDALIARWEGRGVAWLRPSGALFDPDEWLNANDMAARADVKPETVRRWHLRGYITSMRDSDGGLLFNVGEVAALQARRVRS
ncbi:MAG: hypothetical protein CK431_04410 [Mycobacterium sp.]|nr:MAG: hypothetical protein CK431_04410 [Mycobacterium sp.]